jgi:hypothetical protein
VKAVLTRVLRSRTLLANPSPAADQQLDPFAATLADGVFVGYLS